MEKNLIYAVIFAFVVGAAPAKVQHRVKIVSGMISLDDGSLAPREIKYVKFTDSLDWNLNLNPNDTTSLFYRSLLYLRYNSIIIRRQQFILIKKHFPNGF